MDDMPVSNINQNGAFRDFPVNQVEWFEVSPLNIRAIARKKSPPINK